MLRRDRQIRTIIHQWVDAALFAVSFWLTYTLRENPDIIGLFDLKAVPPFATYVWVYLVLIPAAPLILEAHGFYQRPLLAPRRATFLALLKSCIMLCLGLTILMFFLRVPMPRWVLIGFGVISFGVVGLKEELVRLAFRSRLARAQYRKRFILVGVGEQLARLRAHLAAQPQEAMDVVAELDLQRQPIQDLVSLLHEHSVNGVILSAEHTHFEQMEAAIRACEVEGVEAWLVADFFRTQLSRTSLDDFFGRPVLVFRSAPEVCWQTVGKQVGDFLGALVLLVLLAPLFVLVALVIKLTSPGPVLFRQQRCGLNGRPFTMYKFRSMVTDAEQRKHELERLNEMSGPVFKLSDDPRVTPIGRWLRRYSLDELPQLFNVLRGEMSLVGPRPLPVDEVKRFDDFAWRRRLSVRPGLTCLWQISGRSNVTDFKEWVRLDLEYIDNWSLWLDLKILLRTIPVVLLAKGAK